MYIFFYIKTILIKKISKLFTLVYKLKKNNQSSLIKKKKIDKLIIKLVSNYNYKVINSNYNYKVEKQKLLKIN